MVLFEDDESCEAVEGARQRHSTASQQSTASTRSTASFAKIRAKINTLVAFQADTDSKVYEAPTHRKTLTQINLQKQLAAAAEHRASVVTEEGVQLEADDDSSCSAEDSRKNSKKLPAKGSVSGGALVDFIQRLREKDCPKFKLEEVMTDDPAEQKEAPADKLMEGHRYLGPKTFKEALDAVNNELLLAGIMEDVTTFWKTTGEKSWNRPDPKSFRERALEITKYHTEAKCLRHEVTRWLFRYKIVHLRPTDVETAQERHARTQEFWSHFHDGSRKEEVSATVHPFKDDLRRRLHGDEDVSSNNDDGAPVHMGKHRSGTEKFYCERHLGTHVLPGSDGRCSADNGPQCASCRRFQASQPLPTPSMHIRCVQKQTATTSRPSSAGTLRQQPRALDFDWKDRSSRSKVSVGRWDWKHGSPSLSRPGTATGCREKRNGHWSSTLFDMTDAELHEMAEKAEDYEEMLNEGEHTFLSRNLRYKEDGSAHSGIGDLSSSLPNLSPFINRRNSTSLPNLKKSAAATAIRNNVFGEKLDSAAHQRSRHGKADHHARPVVANVHSVPWHSRSPQPALRCQDLPAKQYLRSCRQGKAAPIPMAFITGHSLKLKAGSQVLCDEDLLNITVALDELGLEEIDLEGNTSLTEKSFLTFLQALSHGRASNSLVSLSFKRCLQASKPRVLKSIIDVIGYAVCHLSHLDLTDVTMGLKSQGPFAKAVCNHHGLTSLTLCNTGLGVQRGAEAQEFISHLLGSESIKTMDLGWNCFSAEFFTNIGECLIQVQQLKKLGLANCSSTPKPSYATNICYFLQFLSHDKKLESLDISLNHIDFRGALVVEDALMSCRNLSECRICNNPLGVVGMRSLLRLLCRDSCGMMFFDCRDSFSGQLTEGGEGSQVFRATNPGGRYVLELQRPYHRALLRMLYKTCDRFSIEPADAFSHIVYTKPPFVFAEKDRHKVWIVPHEGKLSLTFSIDKAIEREMRGIHECDFEGHLNRVFELTRSAPSFRKVVPLFAQWKTSSSRMQEQLVMLDAMAKDFALTYTHMNMLCLYSKNLICEIIERLLACVKERPGARFFTLALNKGLPNYFRSFKRVQQFLMFNPQNPNEHYKLNLANHVEHSLAERLLLLDRWESGIAQRSGRMDISQRGNYSVIRNEMYQQHPIEVQAMSEWLLPEYDILEFDYSSNRRPPLDAIHLDDITHANIMVALQQSESDPIDQTAALRMASHTIFFTSKQLRALFGAYRQEAAYAELVVIFVVQVVDMHNEKVFRVRIESPTLLETLKSRLGYLAMFPFIQPEQHTFHFDLAQRDQRIAASCLCILAKYEDSRNLRDPIFILPNGVKDPLTQGVPRSWESLDKVPKGGQLTITYVCGPEERAFQKRKELYEFYGHRVLTKEAHEVMWWSSLTESPEDVIEFLELLTSQFDDMQKAFVYIDGEDGNGIISLREFEDGYHRMGCKKFHGPDEKRRLQVVFRFMDASGEGQLSIAEFMVFDQMFKEILLSIEEFVEFCVRTFGDDPCDTWEFIDDDRSGEVDEEEWSLACDNIGYLGPVLPIFRFLDKDDEGTISLDEFLELEKFFTKAP